MRQRTLRRSRARARVDPELERQLRAAEKGQLVEAVLTLRDAGPAIGPADAAALIERGRARDPAGPIEWNFLPRLGVLIVRACPRVIRRLIAAPEVELASANRPPAAAMPAPA